MPKTGEGIDMTILTKIADKIADLDEFKNTLNTRENDEEFSHGYNAVRMFNTIVIQSAYFDSLEDAEPLLDFLRNIGVLVIAQD